MHKLLIWTGVIVAALVFGVGAAAAVGAMALRLSPISSVGLAVTQAAGNNLQNGSPVTRIPTQTGSIASNQPTAPDLATPTPQAGTPVTPGIGQQPWQGNWGGWDGYEPGMMGGSNWGGYSMGPGMMGSWGGTGMGPGMMGDWNQGTVNPTGERITLDQALDFASQYTASYGSNLEVSEVMEFSENFYAVVREADTGRGAFELLIDPYSGAVYPEMGPNMMWNFKYSPMAGMMGGSRGGDNTLSLDQAIQDGQKYLDVNIPGAKLETDGVSFYGHYTFDYQNNNQIAGMLSVNGITGDVWLHTWHGQFISEREVTK